MLQRQFVRREAITGDSFVSYPDNETGFVAFGKTGIRHCTIGRSDSLDRRMTGIAVSI
ncbi:hypothetical protein [Burkholderia multivorans]|uniref:hypothetical protein n=1 Tax=Burkholderia multivorans TaxID=87883 RepID=UPI0015E37EE4|nr:hypothetical protein [Burkholderia multivorans]